MNMSDLESLLVRLRTRVPTSQDSAAAADAIEKLLKAAPPVVVREYDGLIEAMKKRSIRDYTNWPAENVEIDRMAADALVAMQARIAVLEREAATLAAPCQIDGCHYPAAQARNAALTEALKPFAEIMDEVDRAIAAGVGQANDTDAPWAHIMRDVIPMKEEALIQIDIGKLRRARAALKGGDGE